MPALLFATGQGCRLLTGAGLGAVELGRPVSFLSRTSGGACLALVADQGGNIWISTAPGANGERVATRIADLRGLAVL